MSMIGAKIGTKSWSDARQNEITKSEHVNTNSATDLQQFGADSIGDIANKAADPNWVDPSKKTRAVGSDKLDKDAFMKLMLAQMKNQDPTNPMKNHEMAAQLAQFSSVEQMQNMNTTLSEIQKGQKPSETFQTLAFIGKSVAGDSAKINRLKGDKEHEFSFKLPEGAKDVEVKVRNQEGDIVRKVTLHDMKAGDNHWVWNGKNENGNSTTVGEYQFLIEAKNSTGKKLNVVTDFSGLISGVSYTAEGPVLLVGTQSIKMKDVKKIVDPSLKNNDQKIHNNSSQDLKLGPSASDNTDKGAEEAAPSINNLMTNVGMSSGMMEKLRTDTSALTGPVNIPESKVEVKTESKPPPKSVTKHSTPSAIG